MVPSMTFNLLNGPVDLKSNQNVVGHSHDVLNTISPAGMIFLDSNNCSSQTSQVGRSFTFSFTEGGMNVEENERS